MENSFKLDKDDMMKYFKQIDQALKEQNQHGEIIISGGASMCLVHEARQSTKDIDALYEPKNLINEISQQIADKNNLNSDWINDGVKGFLHPDMKSEVILKFDNLTVSSVSAEALLAMKLTALRARTQDLNDAKFLIKKLNITDENQLLKILEENTYKDKLTVITQYKALDVLNSVNEERKKEQSIEKDVKKGIKERISEVKKTKNSSLNQKEQIKNRNVDYER